MRYIIAISNSHELEFFSPSHKKSTLGRSHTNLDQSSCSKQYYFVIWKSCYRLQMDLLVVSEGKKPDSSKETYSERRFSLFRNLVISGPNDHYSILLFAAAIQGWYLY